MRSLECGVPIGWAGGGGGVRFVVVVWGDLLLAGTAATAGAQPSPVTVPTVPVSGPPVVAPPLPPIATSPVPVRPRNAPPDPTLVFIPSTLPSNSEFDRVFADNSASATMSVTITRYRDRNDISNPMIDIVASRSPWPAGRPTIPSRLIGDWDV